MKRTAELIGDKVTITETVTKEMTKGELQQELLNLNRQKDMLYNQHLNIQTQYNDVLTKITDIENAIALLSKEKTSEELTLKE